MTCKIQQDTLPCCICYTQKENKSIVEYKCVRCKEGVVCEQCAIQLWTANSGKSCPVCNNKTNGRDTWYKPYDIEMGEIKPPNINQSNESYIQDNNEDNVEEDNNPVINLKDNMCLISFIILLTLFIAFIIGTVFKTFESYCAWNCPDEDLAITIITSIAIGMVGLPLVALCLLFAIFFIGVIYEGIKVCSLNIYNKFHVFCNNISYNEIRHSSFNYCKKISYYLSITLLMISVSWGIGTLYKNILGICVWNCADITNMFSFMTSTMIGFLIIMAFTICILIIGLLCICCIALGSRE
tara:strand:+ start:204 stop:1094 length:891 start_codon:yes stop_codon:yes gene_type:complete